MQCSKKNLFNHLVGTAEQRDREGEAKRLGGLQVEISSTFVDWITGRSAGFSPLRIRPV